MNEGPGLNGEISCPVKVVAENNLDLQTSSRLLVRPLSLSSRLGQASKTLVICWGIALVCVFIPGLHLILVPSAVLIGLFFFSRKVRFREMLCGGMIVCPKCRHEFVVPKGGFNWPRREDCPRCGCDLAIDLGLVQE